LYNYDWSCIRSTTSYGSFHDAPSESFATPCAANSDEQMKARIAKLELDMQDIIQEIKKISKKQSWFYIFERSRIILW
jgi:hypothetical protein